jgi:TRAP-type C4-dicarboxylate transport system substrate-binding protein
LALQQGIADGQENPVPVIKAMGFHEVQQYLSLTGHIQSSIQILINDRTWERLSTAEQRVLREVVERLGQRVYRDSQAEEEVLLSQWRQDGTMTVVEDVDLGAFRQRCREYFAAGFPFSELYLEIADMPPSAAGGSEPSSLGAAEVSRTMNRPKP